MFQKPKHYRSREPEWAQAVTEGITGAVRYGKRAVTAIVLGVVAIAASLVIMAAVAVFALMEYRFR